MKNKQIITLFCVSLALISCNKDEINPFIKEIDDSVLLCEIVPDYSWFSDYDSTTDFSISSKEQLMGLSNIVNGKDNKIKYNFTDKNISLSVDIDLSSSIWHPIGEGLVNDWNYSLTNKNNKTAQELNIFCGNFNGNGHKITGLTDQGNIVKEGSFGLFGIIGTYNYGHQIIQNITFTNTHIYGKDKEKSSLYAGVVAGYGCMGGIEFKNITIGTKDDQSFVQSSFCTGGIIGAYYNNYDLVGAGGVTEIHFEECVNNASVVTFGAIDDCICGGILGDVDFKGYATTVNFSKCTNNGRLVLCNTNSTYIGAFMGRLDEPSITNNMPLIVSCEDNGEQYIGKIKIETNKRFGLK